MFGVIILVLVLITQNISCISCEFCNKDFISLGRQIWRCKARITTITATIETNNHLLSPNTPLATQNDNNELITQVENTFDPHENDNKGQKLRCYCAGEFNTLKVIFHSAKIFAGAENLI